MSNNSAFVFCTIATKSYLAQVRALASSLKGHHPCCVLYVLMADNIDDILIPEEEGVQFINIEQLPDQALVRSMCFYYTPFELCCALRGMLHQYMFDNTSADAWVFLDSDIMVFQSLESIFYQLEETSVLLSPHRTEPPNEYPLHSLERSFLIGGVYNAGFLGINRTDESRKFVSWFSERLSRFCLDDPSGAGLFVDQLWLNLVPLYFKGVSSLLDQGANLGHWNVFDKEFGKDEHGNFTVNGKPLLFFHFSGWDINFPDVLSKYTLPQEKIEFTHWAEIAESYRRRLLEHGQEQAVNYPYAFGQFSNGAQITPEMRKIYYAEIQSGNVGFQGSPFEHYSYFQAKMQPKMEVTAGKPLSRLRKRFHRFLYLD